MCSRSKTERPPRRAVSHSIKSFDQAAAFRFLRQPSRPSAPRPVAKSGSAPGRGTTLLTSVNLTTSPNGPAFVETLPGYFSLGFVWTPGTLGTSATLSNLSPDGLSWDLSLVRVNPGATGGGSLSFHDMNGMLTGAEATNCCGSLGTPVGSLQQWSQPGTPQIEAWVDNYFGLSGTVHVVPLPGALPLFAIGLGALGLRGWRRKRKAAA